MGRILYRIPADFYITIDELKGATPEQRDEYLREQVMNRIGDCKYNFEFAWNLSKKVMRFADLDEELDELEDEDEDE